MKKLAFLKPAAVAVCLMIALTAEVLAAPTAEDFGFGKLSEGIGNKPLLLITWQLPSPSPPLAHANDYYDQLFFNFLTFPSVNGYFLENSGGRFLWTRAGVLGPVLLTPAEAATLAATHSIDGGDGVDRFGIDCGAGIGYLLQIIAAKTGYDFTQWDANGDHIVDNSELFIMIVGNNGNTGGANRPIGAAGSGQGIPGQNITLKGRVASLDHQTSFTTFAHEASHSLGTVDLYGANHYSDGLTLMSDTLVSAVDDMHTWHLDPWHKMQLGWVRPRIFTLGAGGAATVTTAQLQSANTPVILYDPARGVGEYFIVEFRNSAPANGGGSYDKDIGWIAGNPQTSGLAVWHFVAGGNPTVFSEGSPNLAMGGSTLWTHMTPFLRWNDGTPITTQINLLSIQPDGGAMVFEWLTRSDTWVDFNYSGSELGTFNNPYNTLAEGLSAVSYGGTLNFKIGSSRETATISKPMTLKGYNGLVTIGH
jgi:M6 family metalloprotease-like protein